MYYAIHDNKVVCTADNLALLKQELTECELDTDLPIITILQKVGELRMELMVKFTDVKS